jgi:hypothetical protein
MPLGHDDRRSFDRALGEHPCRDALGIGREDPDVERALRVALDPRRRSTGTEAAWRRHVSIHDRLDLQHPRGPEVYANRLNTVHVCGNDWV